MTKTILISCSMALLFACSDERQAIEPEAPYSSALPSNQAKASWQFEAIRDQIVVEQCEKLQDPNAFQPSELVWD